MFLKALRALCYEADWCSKDGCRHADIDALYQAAAVVVVAGRRSGMSMQRYVADYIDIVINSGAYTAADLINTFAGII